MNDYKEEGLLHEEPSPETSEEVKTQCKDTYFSDIQINNTIITLDVIRADIEKNTALPEILNRQQVLNILLNDVLPINFREIVYPESTDDKIRPTDRQKYVVIVEELLRLAEERRWGICKNKAFVFVFNGAYWCELDKEVLKKFLGDSAERMGMPIYDARQFTVRDYLLKQFLDTGFQPMPENEGKILINLKNGTFEINEGGSGILRPISKSDFLTYQLPFEFNLNAQCPMFEKYLNECLPDPSAQNVLAEYVGYVFAKNLKLEKALILYGGGANGKSVFFDIITALLGRENVSTYSIDTLCEQNGYYRAMIANKLVNYSSEIGSAKQFNADMFKQLCSGEIIGARLPYGEPFQIENYARMIFNANTLPKDTEQTEAFFRRFLIIPFDVTIPIEMRDVELAKKIIRNELSGVFNWVLAGLDRVVRQKGFSRCIASETANANYRLESDSVAMFIDENDYQPSQYEKMKLRELYTNYQIFCRDSGYRHCGSKEFSKRLKNKHFEVVKIRGGKDVFIEIRADATNSESSIY